MNAKTICLMLAVAMLLAGNARAANLPLVQAVQGSTVAGNTTFLNLTINITTPHQALLNITFTFPASFTISGASITSSSSNITNGTSTVSGQNLTYSLNQSRNFTGGNVSIGIWNIVNANLTGTYYVNVTTYNSTNSSINEAIDTGNASVTITPDLAVTVRAVFSANTSQAGVNFSGNFTSLDKFGNALGDTYNFSSSDGFAMLAPNRTNNGTNVNFSLGTAGARTITAISNSNTSTSNATTFTITVSTIATVQAFYSASSVIAGNNVTGNFTSKDRFGNLVSDTYNYSTSDSAGIMPANGTDNNTNASFQLRTSGSKTITAISSTNSSASNASTFTVNASAPHSVQLFFPITNVTAGANTSANISSMDKFGNLASDTYNFSSTDTLAVLPANGSANGSNINFSLKTAGSKTITIASISNASATNATSFIVNASTVEFVQAYYLLPVVVVGVNFAMNFTSKDRFGNLVNDTYNFSSSSVNVTPAANGSANSTNLNFSIATNGTYTITAISQGNTTATNASSFTTISNYPSTVQVVFNVTTIMANGTFHANISSVDKFGNPVSDRYTITSSDSQAVLPADSTSNGTLIAFTLKTSGTQTITITSKLNSSASNLTGILINTSTVVQVQLSPLVPSITTAATQQFTATLKDAFGNTNTTVSANFNVTALTGGGSISASGLFTPSSAGTVTVSANYSNIWNSTNVTITTTSPSPSPSPTTQTGTNPGPTVPIIYTPTPTPRASPSPSPAPTPTPKGKVAIVETPTPTPIPYKTDAEAQVSSAEKEIADLKSRGITTELTEAESLLTTAKEQLSKQQYQLALQNAQKARQLIADLIRGTPTPSLEFVGRKGEINWGLIILSILLVSAGVVSYFKFAGKQRKAFHERHHIEQAKPPEPAEIMKKEIKRKHKGDIDFTE